MASLTINQEKVTEAAAEGEELLEKNNSEIQKTLQIPL
jgi:hypothetical protein